jgi:hypothetical protein
LALGSAAAKFGAADPFTLSDIASLVSVVFDQRTPRPVLADLP